MAIGVGSAHSTVGAWIRLIGTGEIFWIDAVVDGKNPFMFVGRL